MVAVKSRSDGPLAAFAYLGLASGPIVVTPEFYHKDMIVDAWGQNAPVDTQFMLASAHISMRLIHFDRTVLNYCIAAACGSTVVGGMARAGYRMGGNVARFAPGNNYIGLNIASPVDLLPWRFLYTYLYGQPIEYPLGTEKSEVLLNWRAIPYTTDPWGGSVAQPNTLPGTGANGAILWDNTSDT